MLSSWENLIRIQEPVFTKGVFSPPLRQRSRPGEVRVAHAGANSCTDRGNDCSFQPDFRAPGESLFHVYVLHSQKDKSLFSASIENTISECGPFVLMGCLQIRANPHSSWDGEGPDREVSTVSMRQVCLPQGPAEGPLPGSWRNCLNILGLETSSALALLLAAWILETLSTSLHLLSHACQNADSPAALRRFATRNNQTDISRALGTLHILNYNKDVNNDHCCLTFYSHLLKWFYFILFTLQLPIVT